MNSICIIGRLTADPELRRTKNGKPVCSFTVAVDRPFDKENTDFISCVAWNQSAEYLGKYGSKGTYVGVSGSLQGRRWTDKEGKKHTAWEVIAERLELPYGRRENTECSDASNDKNVAYTPPGRYQGENQQSEYVPIVEPDAELPF